MTTQTRSAARAAAQYLFESALILGGAALVMVMYAAIAIAVSLLWSAVR